MYSYYIISHILLYIYTYTNIYIGVILGICNITAGVVCHVCIPETAGRSLEGEGGQGHDIHTYSNNNNNNNSSSSNMLYNNSNGMLYNNNTYKSPTYLSIHNNDEDDECVGGQNYDLSDDYK